VGSKSAKATDPAGRRLAGAGGDEIACPRANPLHTGVRSWRYFSSPQSLFMQKQVQLQDFAAQYLAAQRYLVPLLALLFLSVPLQAQVNASHVTIQVIDSYEKNFRNLLSNDDSAIQINLVQIKKEANDTAIYRGGLDIRIANENVSQTISSRGIAITGDFGIAIGGGRQEVVTLETGQVFLQLEEVNTLIDFLNSTILRSNRKQDYPQYDMTWRIEMDNGLVWGFLYDSQTLSKYFYYLELGQSRFEIPVSTAKEMLLMIGKARKWLQEEYPIEGE